VPERDVLGEVNRGWSVAMATTGSERGLTLRSPSRFVTTANRLVDLARSGSPDSAGLNSAGLNSAGLDSAGLDSAGLDSGLRDRVVQSWIEARAYHLFTLEQVTGIVAGNSPGARSSLNKLYWSELDVRLHETAMELLGADAEADGPWSRGFEFSLAGPIYAGTNEIQRNIVAERLLGLPRA
jgi:alkylation response protein AidB-like acyl-CoA dehydrogenase